jgi:hypothetical protein
VKKNRVKIHAKKTRDPLKLDYLPQNAVNLADIDIALQVSFKCNYQAIANSLKL